MSVNNKNIKKDDEDDIGNATDSSEDNEINKCGSSKRPFTMTEDRSLAHYVTIQGPKNWATIATKLKGRTAKQCRERWHYHLDPKINKGPWTAVEDIILAKKHMELGNRWADIARSLPGRTDTLVKNRWNTSVKQRVHEILMKDLLENRRNENKLIRQNIIICSEDIIKNLDIIPPLKPKSM